MTHAPRSLLLATSLALLPFGCVDKPKQDTPVNPGPGDPNVVAIDSGLIKGSSTASMRTFKGIPYAAPPVGDLRWRPPTAPDDLDGTLDATKLGPHCAQTASPCGVASTSEDCLYLNVYAPTAGGLHPVM